MKALMSKRLDMYSAALMAAFIMEAAVDRKVQYAHLLAHCEVDGALEKVDRMVTMAVPFSEFLAHMVTEKGFSIPGIFHYEVAALYGYWYLEYVQEHNEEPSWKECAESAEKLITQFFAPDAEATKYLLESNVLKNCGIIANPSGKLDEVKL